MRGTIDFFDTQRDVGYVIPEKGECELHFNSQSLSEAGCDFAPKGSKIEFETADGNIVASISQISPITDLWDWAYLPFFYKDGQNAFAEKLATLALDEDWHFGSNDNSTKKYPILVNYIRHTFSRLSKSEPHKIFELCSKEEKYATFNTGLVDSLYDPIYAFFSENQRGKQPWEIMDFCVPGKGSIGKKLADVFEPLPEPTNYFSNPADMIFDTTKTMHLEPEHIVIDAVKNNRYPYDFLFKYRREYYSWTDYRCLKKEEKRQALQRLSDAISSDDDWCCDIFEKICNAKEFAYKKARWNYKTAIPQYYPAHNVMGFFLPLSLMSYKKADVALVISKYNSGAYQGRTVIPLDIAYKNARLVCRPDSDWLIARSLVAEQDIDEDNLSVDEDDRTFEADESIDFLSYSDGSIRQTAKD